MNVLLALVIACSPADRYGGEYHMMGMQMPEPSAGAAKSFMGFNVAMHSQVPVEDFPGAQAAASDICGYVSPSGREYALIGFRKGMGFCRGDRPGESGHRGLHRRHGRQSTVA